jgi:signal transduction histidine kinase
MSTCALHPDTWFAPAQRASEAQLRRGAEVARTSELLRAVLEAMPGFAVVVNQQRQIVAANRRMVEALGVSTVESILGQRPGEALDCVSAASAPSGCGTSPTCAFCAAAAMMEALRDDLPVRRECRILRRAGAGSALDLEVIVTPAHLGELVLMVVTMRDTSSENRRRVLERAFFHDVLNTAATVRAVASLMTKGAASQPAVDYKAMLLDSSQQLVDEIQSQQMLMSAESGELRARPQPVGLRDLLRHVHAQYVAHEVAEGRTLVLGGCPDIILDTDPLLLRRIVANLVKNGLEAVPTGETVTLGADCDDERVVVWVHNPGEIPAEIRPQIFLRSFSTKGQGRGVGTYSVKLLGERYLQGGVRFRTCPEHGTRFEIVLPRQAQPAASPPLPARSPGE